MIKLGIIGGIGSGKSFIAKLFKSPVFNADKEVNYLYKNTKIASKIEKQIQNFVKSFPISKKELIAAIDHNSANLKNIINHTSTGKKKKNTFLKTKNKIIILDIPLLVENKLYEKFIYFVDSKKSKVLNRLKKAKL